MAAIKFVSMQETLYSVVGLFAAFLINKKVR